MIRHPVFFRKLGDRTIVMAIIDSDMVKDLYDSDSFVMSKTEKNIKGQLTMTCDGIKLSSHKYAELCSKNCGFPVESTIGDSLGGIATGMYWFIKQTKSILDQMKG